LREREAVEARRLAQEAQLQMLAYQLNPHFLFNALTSIRAMIDEDRARARQMVTELAAFLRHALV
jgi:LytS/YehU family sensor histidine kinase